MNWYSVSYGWILKQRNEHSEMTRDELRKHCSKNYPFDMRRGYAYKAFLKAMRDYFGHEKKGKIEG